MELNLLYHCRDDCFIPYNGFFNLHSRLYRIKWTPLDAICNSRSYELTIAKTTLIEVCCIQISTLIASWLCHLQTQVSVVPWECVSLWVAMLNCSGCYSSTWDCDCFWSWTYSCWIFLMTGWQTFFCELLFVNSTSYGTVPFSSKFSDIGSVVTLFIKLLGENRIFANNQLRSIWIIQPVNSITFLVAKRNTLLGFGIQLWSLIILYMSKSRTTTRC